MQQIRMLQRFRNNNKGNFTVEATFVMLIIMGVILSILFVTLYCTDCTILESTLRKQIRNDNAKGTISGLLGEGDVRNTSGWDIWCATYEVKYDVGIQYPFTEEYLGNEFEKVTANVTICDKDTCEFIRMYEALRSKG